MRVEIAFGLIVGRCDAGVCDEDELNLNGIERIAAQPLPGKHRFALILCLIQ